MTLSNTYLSRSDLTIADFGEQWTHYTTNDGYYASTELFRDICGPLIDPMTLVGARVADIGSGTGRIVSMLLASGVAHVIAVEPSEAFNVLKANTADNAISIQYIHGRGEAIPADQDLDYVFSIGVLHHIDDPASVIEAAYAALRSGGKMLVWLYGREGNEAYLSLAEALRPVTVRMPRAALVALSHVLNVALALYIPLCRVLPLPLRDYMRHVIGRFSWHKRFLVIFDQLNPTVAHYYTREQAEALLADSGFQNVRAHHRHGYSWTVMGEKP